MPRLLELILTADGGAELWDTNDESIPAIWTSDSDDDFREEFPEIVDENDLEHVQDYLVAKGIITEDEADIMECSAETLEPQTVNGDEEEDEEEDEDEEDF